MSGGHPLLIAHMESEVAIAQEAGTGVSTHVVRRWCAELKRCSSEEIQPLTLAGMSMDSIERLAIESTLLATNGNRKEAAAMLEIGERTLYRKIEEFDLDRAPGRPRGPRKPGAAS